jgi:hypothetical protein
MGTLRHIAAAGAVDVRAEPPAVQQQHHLPARLQGITYVPFERRADGAGFAFAFRFVPQIHEPDGRHRPRFDPRRQRQQLQLTALRPVIRFERRRRRAENDRNAGQVGPHHGHVPGVIPRR